MSATLVIVDDDASFRRRARAMLEAGGFVVVGEAGDAEQAGRIVAGSCPQAVLVDIQLPDGDGFEVAERLLAVTDRPEVVLMSGRGRSEYGTRIADCGALGFIDKLELSAASLQAMLYRLPL